MTSVAEEAIRSIGSHDCQRACSKSLARLGLLPLLAVMTAAMFIWIHA